MLNTIFCLLIFAARLPIEAQEKPLVTLEKAYSEWTGEQTLELNLTFHIQDGLYIQVDRPSDPYLIPTEISFSEIDCLEKIDLHFPEYEMRKVYDNNSAQSIFSGVIQVKAFFNFSCRPNLKEWNGVLYFQACSDRKCFYPRTLEFSINLFPL